MGPAGMRLPPAQHQIGMCSTQKKELGGRGLGLCPVYGSLLSWHVRPWKENGILGWGSLKEAGLTCFELNLLKV